MMRTFVIFLSLIISPTLACASGFFNQQNQYKGFYWFERLQRVEKEGAKEYQPPSPEQALALIEARKKQLDDARNQMVAIGFDANAPKSAKRQGVIEYKKLEREMWDGVIDLVEASDMANFTNPEIADNSKQPTNVFGVKLKRKLEEEETSLAILEFAKDFDLLLFADNTCPYCREFAPVLKRFVDEYHFELDVTSLDSKAGELAKSLGITSTPTLVAMKKDGNQLFEISRGMVSISGLESSILLAKKYSEELSENNRKSATKSNIKTKIKMLKNKK